MTSPRTHAGVLGAADGVTSIAGVMAGGAAVGIGPTALAVTALGGAFAATVSMAGAELLSEDTPDRATVIAMALGTLAGAGLPALPLLFLTGTASVVVVVLVSALIAVVVAEVRHRCNGQARLLSALLTFAVLAAGGAVGLAAGALG